MDTWEKSAGEIPPFWTWLDLAFNTFLLCVFVDILAAQYSEFSDLSLKSYDWKYCSLIYCERKILLEKLQANMLIRIRIGGRNPQVLLVIEHVTFALWHQDISVQCFLQRWWHAADASCNRLLTWLLCRARPHGWSLWAISAALFSSKKIAKFFRFFVTSNL